MAHGDTTISTFEFFDMIPDAEAARLYLEERRWHGSPTCPLCGAFEKITARTGKRIGYYRCHDCAGEFTVRTGTIFERSHVPLNKWVYAMYLVVTARKGISSLQLSKEIGVTQKTAWFMLQRIRDAFDDNDDPPFGGPAEVDEAYFGGRERNKHAHKKTNAGRGTVGKTAVVGAKDRDTGKVKARVVPRTDRETLRLFVEDSVEYGATLYTDGATAYDNIADLLNGIRHEAVNHNVGEYVRGQAHTNGVESFWSMLKRGFHGTYHRISPKHLHRYVAEFAGRQGVRDMDTVDQMVFLVRGMSGKRLRYDELIS